MAPRILRALDRLRVVPPVIVNAGKSKRGRCQVRQVLPDAPLPSPADLGLDAPGVLHPLRIRGLEPHRLFGGQLLAMPDPCEGTHGAGR